MGREDSGSAGPRLRGGGGGGCSPCWDIGGLRAQHLPPVSCPYKDGGGGVRVLLNFLLSGSSSLGPFFPLDRIAVQHSGLGQGALVSSPDHPPSRVPGMRPPSACSFCPLGVLPGNAAHSLASGPRLLPAVRPRPALLLRLTGVAPSVFIFPWVERELLESGSGEAGVWSPPPQRLLEAQALCAGVGREWTFCLALWSDRAGPCSCLGPGL